MTNLTYAQLEGVWLQAAAGTRYATQEWAALMAAIAEAESGGNPAATNPTDNGGRQTSWGLWQISNGDHSQPSGNWNNPIVNAQLAIGKLNGQGLGAWGTYNSGAYKAYISGSTTPDTSGIELTAADSVTGAEATSAAGAQSDCAWNLSFGSFVGLSVGKVCVLSKSQVRGFAGVGLIVAGGLLMLAGSGVVLAAAGLAAGEKILAFTPAGKIGRLAGASRSGSRSPLRVSAPS